jgi:hypothetical protein
MSGINVPSIVMVTGANAVAGGIDGPGWMSGDLASLGAAASADMLFDLGRDWEQYHYAQISFSLAGPSSGLTAITALGNMTKSLTVGSRLVKNYSAVFAALNEVLTTAAGPSGIVVRPMGRFLIVKVTNADGANPLGALSQCSVAAYPG